MGESSCVIVAIVASLLTSFIWCVRYLLIKMKEAKIEEYENPSSLETFPTVYNNIGSILSYLGTQDIRKILQGTCDSENGLVTILFMKDRLREIRSSGYRFSYDDTKRESQVRVCRVLEQTLNSFDGKPEEYTSSENPVIRVISFWANMEKILEDIIASGEPS